MLPILKTTDLLLHDPDSSEILLWSDDFVWDMIPAKIGCYAFYEKSGVVVYIGSACITDSSPANIGLRQRLRHYRGRGPSERPSTTVRRIRRYDNKQTLWLKCWIADSPGDCRKYEEDSIRIHNPKLNIIGNRALSENQIRLRKNQWAKNRASRLRDTVYDPNKTRKCTICEKLLKCSNFKRNASKLYGVIARCKICVKSS